MDDGAIVLGTLELKDKTLTCRSIQRCGRLAAVPSSNRYSLEWCGSPWSSAKRSSK